MPVMPEKQQASLQFRSKEQQLLLRTKSRMEAALREAMIGRGMSLTQMVCMYDLGLTNQLTLSQQDKGRDPGGYAAVESTAES